MLRRRSREPPNRQMREPPSSFANAFRVAYGSHSLRLLCCHLCCIAFVCPLCWHCGHTETADEQIEDDEDGRSKTLSGELQRKLRGGAGAVAGALVLAHASYFGLSLPSRRAAALRHVCGGLPYGALCLWSRLLHAVPAALGRRGLGHHLRRRPQLQPDELRE